MKHTIDIYNALSTIIKRSSKVIYADAFISNRTLNFIRDVRKNREASYMIHNTIPRQINKIAKQVKGTEFNDMILTMLADNKNIYIASTSKTKLNLLEQHQKINLPDCKSIYYHGTNNKQINDTLKNVNMEWVDKQLIATTPKITVGISFDKHHFDNCIIDATNSFGPCTRDIMQMTMRVRNFTNNTLYFALPYKTINKCNKKYLYKCLQDLENETNDKFDIITSTLTREQVDDDTIFDIIKRLKDDTPEGLKRILYFNLKETILSQFHFKKLFLIMLKKLNYNVITLSDKETKPEKATNDIDYVTDYNNIETVLNVDELKTQQMTDHDEFRQLIINKHYYEKIINSCDDITELKSKMFFDVYCNTHKKKMFDNLRLEKSKDDYITILEKEIIKRDNIIYNMNLDANKCDVIKTLNSKLNILHSQDNSTIIIKKNVMTDVNQYLTDNFKHLTTLYKSNSILNSNIKQNGIKLFKLLENIYFDWGNMKIKAESKDRNKTALTYKLDGYNIYDHVKAIEINNNKMAINYMIEDED